MSNEIQKQLAELKDNYIVSLPDKIAAIRSLWASISEEKNSIRLEELHRMVHSLAGSGATFDQVQVSENSKALESYIKKHALKDAIFNEVHVLEVEDYLQKLEKSVNRSSENRQFVDDALIDGETDNAEATLATLATMKVDPMCILLVDDDPVIRKQLNEFLKSRGHKVYEASNGHEAIDIFDEIALDLVMMDVVMPGMAGYEATKIIKEKSGNKFIPVIFITSSSDNETLARCIAAGGDDFLTKPVNHIILNAKLQSFQRIRIMYEKLDEYQRKTEEELETSMHVFNSLIDTANDDIAGLSCWADSPGHFSGDTRLFRTLGNGHVYVLLCDFTGHGLPAAIGTVFAADLFRSMTQKGFDALVIFNEINSKMHQILPTGRYCAAIMIDYDPVKSNLKIWNSGLPSAYLVDASFNITQEFPSVGVPLGVIGGDARCEPVEVDISKSEAIILFSDGITEAENPQGDMYLEQRLLDCIAGTKKDVFNTIKQDVETFMQGIEPTDDISLVVLNFSNKQ